MKITALILCVVMFCLPAVSVAGDYGCRSYTTHQTYAAPTYYSNQSYAGYQQSYNTVYPYAIPVAILPSTFYQVAPELAQARIQAEVVSAAVKEALKAQGEMFERLSRNPQYIQQVPYLPQGTYAASPIPPANNYEPPPGYRLVPIETERPTAKAPEVPALPPVPAVQPKEKEPVPVPKTGKDGKQITAVAAIQAMANESCIKCHKANSARLDLTDVSKLTLEQLGGFIGPDNPGVLYRILSLDKNWVMPPPQEGKPVKEEYLGAVHYRIGEMMAAAKKKPQ